MQYEKKLLVLVIYIAHIVQNICNADQNSSKSKEVTCISCVPSFGVVLPRTVCAFVSGSNGMDTATRCSPTGRQNDALLNLPIVEG